MTFNEAKELFKTAKNKTKGKPLGNNIRLLQYGESYAIRYHETIILVIDPHGGYLYDNGGWFTVSTKKNLNKYGPANIYQRKGIWFIRKASGDITYYNGMEIFE